MCGLRTVDGTRSEAADQAGEALLTHEGCANLHRAGRWQAVGLRPSRRGVRHQHIELQRAHARPERGQVDMHVYACV